MKAKIYTLEAISNLHVGSGNDNYGVVDNLIQRDIITTFPIIHSSSLKGALRKYYSSKIKEEEAIVSIFGSAPKDKDKRESGSYRFFDASLLALPVRSDKVPFFLATCPLIISDFLNKTNLFSISLNIDIKNTLELLLKSPSKSIVFNENYKEAYIEDLKETTIYTEKPEKMDSLIPLFGTYPLVLLNNDDFKTLCDDFHLPVIARNYLNDGKSESLFYEQVLPRFSKLYYIACQMSDIELPPATDLVQIGANASVGYGYCKLLDLK